MKILELPMPFVTPSNILLPRKDEYGWPHGDNYEALKEARTVRLSTRTTFRGLKFKRRYEALSMNELRPLFGFGFNPYVVDIRDQYGMYNPDRYDRAVRAGRRMLLTDVMTIDILLTLVLPPDYRLHYHGISIKDSKDKLNAADRRRHEREEASLAALGWTWECLRGDQFSKLSFSNYFVMYRCIRDINVFEQYENAKWFSNILLKSATRGTFGSILARISKRLNISDNTAHRLFSVAAAFGFLTIDHTKPLRVDSALHLIR
jgi:hypothetical protein